MLRLKIILVLFVQMVKTQEFDPLIFLWCWLGEFFIVTFFICWAFSVGLGKAPSWVCYVGALVILSETFICRIEQVNEERIGE